jgi:hypothetical protein
MKASIVFGSKAVTTAGEPEALSDAELTTNRFNTITVQALVTNTGSVYVQGNDDPASPRIALTPGQSLPITVPTQKDYLTLEQIFIDADVDGEGVFYTFCKS